MSRLMFLPARITFQQVQHGVPNLLVGYMYLLLRKVIYW